MSTALNLPAVAPKWPTSRLELISVEKAKEALANRAPNRDISECYVKQMAADMRKADGWEVNGETIKFDLAGRLVDGQHRMTACVEANTPFWAFVVYGIASHRNVDQGKIRGVADALTIFDERVTGPRTGIAMEGSLGHVLVYGRRIASESSPALNLSRGARREILQTNKALDRALPQFIGRYVIEGGPRNKTSPLRPSVALALLWVAEIGGQDTKDLHLFLEGVRDGLALLPGDPAAAYRNMIISASLRRRIVGTREAFLLALNAAVAHLTKKQMQMVRLSTTVVFPGAPPEKVLANLGFAE